MIRRGSPPASRRLSSSADGIDSRPRIGPGASPRPRSPGLAALLGFGLRDRVRRPVRLAAAVLSLSMVLATPGAAEQEIGAGSAGEADAPTRFVTTHRGTFGGEDLEYTATAGETWLRDDGGQPTAAIFAFAYVRDGVEDPSTRPVAFVWNGGPGSSSIWLHMGSLGPRRVRVPSEAEDDGAPPYVVEDNVETLLDVTDLVFVDPVGTGFSRPLGERQATEFWGLREDADSMAAFIRAWLTENRRWASPKYLVGESFGTTRAAAVAGRLEGGGVSLNGLVLISQALDYTGSTPSHDNLIAYVTYLPTMAATAWYHGRVENAPESLEEFLEAAREFAVREYAPALLQGSRLDAGARARVAERLAHFTGLTREYVELADLRILADRFRKQLLRDEGLVVGRSDGRYTGDDVDDTAERPDGDPSSYGIDGAYTAVFQDYIADELGVAMDRPYRTSGGRELYSAWNWKPTPEGQGWEPHYVNVARDLSRALRRNDDLRVLVASGYYDYATPFFDAEYTFARHGILPGRVTMTYYEAGHMMYLHHPSAERLLRDIRDFIGG